VGQALGLHLEPLAGGHSGETFSVDLGGESAVLRVCARDPSRAAVLAGVHRLVARLLPVPRVLDVRLTPPAPMPPFLLFERLAGVRLDSALAAADDETCTRLGIAVADVAAILAGIPFAVGGAFSGLDLHVEPFGTDFGPIAMAERVLASPFGGALRRQHRDNLLRVATEAEDLIATTARVCLVHSDFNPKNLLVDPVRATVTGLVDWEYTHAGSPLTDAGNLLRFGDHPLFDAAFATRFFEVAPALPAEGIRVARALDLVSLLDLVLRDATAPNPITTRAAALVAETARTGSLAASRIDPVELSPGGRGSAPGARRRP
jgi:aminoglycoside phosphotransferase (APT) family kinase protein